MLCDLYACYVVDFTDSRQDFFYNLQMKAYLGASLRPPPVAAILRAWRESPSRKGSWAVIRRVPRRPSCAFWLVQSMPAYHAVLAPGVPTSTLGTVVHPAPSLAGGEHIALQKRRQSKVSWELRPSGSTSALPPSSVILAPSGLVFSK